MRRLLFAALLLTPAVGLAAPGDVYEQSDGPAVHVPRVKPPPLPTFCQEQSDDAAAREACKQGVRAARKAADLYAGSRGLEDGYLRGYAWGLFKGFQQGKSDDSAADRGKTAAFESEKLNAAVQDAKASGAKRGKADGAAEAGRRFDEAFAAERLPDTRLRKTRIEAPAAEWPADPHQAFYGKVPETPALLVEEAGGEEVEVAGAANRAYFEGKHYPVRVLFEVSGEHQFDWKAALDGDAGWKAWLAAEDDRTAYEALSGGARTAFEEAFRQAYENEARYRYSNKFYRALDVGSEDGFTVGKRVGMAQLYHTTLRKHVNAQFAKKVPPAFQTAYQDAYAEAFEAYVAERSEPMLSYSDVELLDEVEDGILTPGEQLKVRVEITNKGLKDGNVPIEIQGPVGEVQPVWVSAPKFRTVTRTTDLIAQLDPTQRVGKKTKLTISVDEKKWAVERTVRQVLELSDAKVDDVDALTGRGVLFATLTNPATRPSPKRLTVRLLIDDTARATLEPDPVPAGSEQVVELSFSKVDPLALIVGTSADIVIERADKPIFSGSVTVRSPEPEATLSNYYDALVYEEAYVPEGTTREEQVQRAANELVARGRTEVTELKKKLFFNAWKRTPRETMVGRVSESFETATGDARAQYRLLLSELCSLKTSVPRLFGKRKAYEQLCAPLSTPEPDQDPTEKPDGSEAEAKAP